MLKYPARLLGALLLALAAAATLAAPASAHERREVGGILMVVGFGIEPAFAYYPNSVELSLTRENNQQPVVEGVDLEVEVSFGEESTTMDVEPGFVVGAFGEPGTYGADFIPSRPGPYTFRFTGAIGDQGIDESFTSGPETFSEASDPAEVSFPARDPSNAELADRIESESASFASSVAGAADEAENARAMATIALIAGIVGAVLGLGGIVLGLRKRSA